VRLVQRETNPAIFASGVFGVTELHGRRNEAAAEERNERCLIKAYVDVYKHG
jgi:hypothetical protein